MTHVRQHWPRRWLHLFDGETLQCLFTSPSVVCGAAGSLKSSGRSSDAASRPKKREERRPYWQHLLKTHGRNETHAVWSGTVSDLNGREEEEEEEEEQLLLRFFFICPMQIAVQIYLDSKCLWSETSVCLSERFELIPIQLTVLVMIRTVHRQERCNTIRIPIQVWHVKILKAIYCNFVHVFSEYNDHCFVYLLHAISGICILIDHSPCDIADDSLHEIY